MAVISNNDIARAVYLLSKDKTHAEQTEISKKVVSFLSRKRMLSKSPEILSRLTKIVNEGEGRVVAEVTSATKLESKTKTHLTHDLKKRYGAKEVDIVEIIDPGLLGGVKIEVDGEVIDLSIKNKVAKLQEYLTK